MDELRSFKRKRIVVLLKAGISVQNRNYEGIIENVSEDGVYVRVAPTRISIGAIPGITSELFFELPSKEKIFLKSEVIWVHMFKKADEGIITCMGMQIKDPPQGYKNYVKSLH